MSQKITALFLAAVMTAASVSSPVTAAQIPVESATKTQLPVESATETQPVESATKTQTPVESTEPAAVSASSKTLDLTAGRQGYREWETDIRLQIRNELQMMQAAGMTQDEWDLAAAQGKQKGLNTPVTEEMIRSADEHAQILRNESGQIYFISGDGIFDAVCGPADACRLVYSLVPMFGGKQEITLLPWSTLHMNDTTVYSFQQVSSSEMVLGSTVKVAVNPDNTVSAVFNALDPESMSKIQDFISREQAEETVSRHLKIEGIETGVLSRYTHRMHRYPEGLEEALNLDNPAEENIPDQVFWTVYSENIRNCQAGRSVGGWNRTGSQRRRNEIYFNKFSSS